MVRRHPWERRRPRRQGFPGCIRVRPPTLEPLSTGATGYSSTAETVMVSGPPCERRRPRRQGFPNSMRVRPPTLEPLPTGATGNSSTPETLMVRRQPWERRRPRRQGFPGCIRVSPPTLEPLSTGATGCSSQWSVLGRRGRRRSQGGIRGTLPASNASLQRFPRWTGRDWRVPVGSVRLTDLGGHRKFARAGSVMVRGHPCPHQRRHSSTSRD